MVERGSRWRSPWPPVIAAAAPVLLTAWSVSPPGGYFTMALVALLCWVVVGLLWLVVGVRAVVALPRPRLRHVGRLWPFLVLPALAVTTEVVIDSGVVQRWAFDVHRSGLEALVADVRAAPDQRLTDRRVGLYEVATASADPLGGCTLLTVADAGFLDRTGFAHCPHRPPVGVVGGEGLVYEPVDGPWHVFTHRW
ncbi:hypothetical protein [Saccharothrix sp. HUAS TT1]|uniref:hypothetical protein n=1 Tax=unclassified Saccharothrix TaxID=2593673 RepID=UPI00345C0AE3